MLRIHFRSVTEYGVYVGKRCARFTSICIINGSLEMVPMSFETRRYMHSHSYLAHQSLPRCQFNCDSNNTTSHVVLQISQTKTTRTSLAYQRTEPSLPPYTFAPFSLSFVPSFPRIAQLTSFVCEQPQTDCQVKSLDPSIWDFLQRMICQTVSERKYSAKASNNNNKNNSCESKHRTQQGNDEEQEI